jgi:hypothetical protein
MSPLLQSCKAVRGTGNKARQGRRRTQGRVCKPPLDGSRSRLVISVRDNCQLNTTGKMVSFSTLAPATLMFPLTRQQQS